MSELINLSRHVDGAHTPARLGPTDVVVGRRYHDPAEVRVLFRERTRRSRHEVLAMLRDDADTADVLQADREIHVELARAGVRSLLLCEASMLSNSTIYHELRERAAAGVSVRMLRSMPCWVAVFDQRSAIVPAGGGGQEATALTDPEIVSSMRRLFRQWWAESTELKSADSTQRERDRRILSLMREGTTDELGARRMNVSLRTYRRYVSSVMDRLGARNRFEAGALAAEWNLV